MNVVSNLGRHAADPHGLNEDPGVLSVVKHLRDTDSEAGKAALTQRNVERQSFSVILNAGHITSCTGRHCRFHLG